MLVVEAIPAKLAGLITERVGIPVIGIGAGATAMARSWSGTTCSGIEDRHAARFVKRYGNLPAEIGTAIGAFAGEVGSGAYPQPGAYLQDEGIGAR